MTGIIPQKAKETPKDGFKLVAKNIKGFFFSYFSNSQIWLNRHYG
jgi:hypothetical protein